MKHDENRDEEVYPPAGLSSHIETPDDQADTPPDALASSNDNDDAKTFAANFNLIQHLDLLQKAAALIHDHAPISEIPGITIFEVTALQNETSKKWQQPLTLYLTITVTALGAIGQGWAQTSMNGANLYFPKAFGIDSSNPRDSLIIGLINSGIYLSNGLLGSWLVSPLNANFGRRGAVFAAALISLLTNVGCALTQNWQQLLFFRLVLGCALGIISSTLNVYAAECAPATIRGGLAVSWQMFCAFGIFVGFVANVAVYDFGPNTWRLQLAAPALSTIPLLCLVYFCPESPAWHIKHGSRYDLALQSLVRLRNTELQAAKEIYQSYTLSTPDSKAGSRSSFFQTLFDLFTVPRIRRATLAAYTVMISQQLCGINIIAFYSSTIFSDAGFSTFGALIASCVFGFVNFIGAFPAVWTMDTLGRRSLLLITLPFMALTMFLASLAFSIPDSNSAHFVLLATMIYLFCALYSPGMGPVPAAYSAEVFPLSHRELGVSSAVAVTNLWASVLGLTFPRLLTALGSQGAFILYAVLNVLALILVFLFVPETKMKALNELDAVFSVSTRSFARYQVMEYLPWWTRRYLLRQKSAELAPLDETHVVVYKALEQDEEEIP